MRLAVRMPGDCPDSNPLGPVLFRAQLRPPASPGQPGTRGGHLGRITGLEAGGRRLAEALTAQSSYPSGMETAF